MPQSALASWVISDSQRGGSHPYSGLEYAVRQQKCMFCALEAERKKTEIDNEEELYGK